MGIIRDLNGIGEGYIPTGPFNSYNENNIEKEERKRRCWSCGCRKTGWIEDFTGYRYCLTHWRLAYRYGTEEGFLRSLKNSKFDFIKFLKQ